MNLLQVPYTGSVHLIDHNMSFDPEFDPVAFWNDHVFHADVGHLPPEWLQAAKQTMHVATATLGKILDGLPQSWIDSATLLPAFTFDRIAAIISHPKWPDALLTGGAS